MPYNYPELFTLLSMFSFDIFHLSSFSIYYLDDLNTVHGSNVTKSWQNRFDTYLRSIPPYYLPVRICLSTNEVFEKFVFSSHYDEF